MTGLLKEGVLVDYWRGIKEGPPSGRGKVRGVGEVGGSAVAWIEGCSGCIALSHIELAAEGDE